MQAQAISIARSYKKRRERAVNQEIIKEGFFYCKFKGNIKDHKISFRNRQNETENR